MSIVNHLEPLITLRSDHSEAQKAKAMEEAKEAGRRVKPEVLRNTPGSSAGANSSRVHIYRQHRRREEDRLEAIEETLNQDAAEALFRERQQAAEESAAATTQRRRERRERRKRARQHAAIRQKADQILRQQRSQQADNSGDGAAQHPPNSAPQ